MKKVLFIDRDGTIIEEPKDTFQIDRLDLLAFRDEAIEYLNKISKLDFELVMVSNQDGLGTPSYTYESFDIVQNKMLADLEKQDVIFDSIHIDGSFEHENKPTRKPNTGMLTKYFSNEYDLKNSYVIGDRETDQILANNLGSKCIIIRNHQNPEEFKVTAQYVVSTWKEILEILQRS